ncbi:39S ribosomal protein L10, mitochondrial [Glossina fuscipes]|uniref:Large ribosomal subunit protein uL10m n=1 Tax=Glossina fuscipes TaxID=7396 RepID=A0A8U0WLP7_9MUSC|nr:39S ribosomal protein L10, mitochondrial [Glossina fuscipes]KAI9584074.1 hypothetical protein GQX74_010409 [Glossina fuscipes]
MTQLIKRDILQLVRHAPLLQFQRFRGKINIQRPRKPHYDRALVAAVTQPQYPKPNKTNTCFEKRYTNAQIDNPYNDIIAREVRNWFDHSSMVGIFHLNSMKAEDFFDVRVQLHKQGMHLKSYGQKIINKAIKDSRYEAILPLFDSSHCIVFAPHQKVGLLLRTTRKVPQMVLLAGMVDNTLLSRKDFIAYAQLPGIQAAQAELVNTLNISARSVVQNLETHQNNFVNILEHYAKCDENKK